MSYLFTKEQGILKNQKTELMMKKHLIFLVFIVMVFILALVVKINNDHKKRASIKLKDRPIFKPVFYIVEHHDFIIDI